MIYRDAYIVGKTRILVIEKKRVLALSKISRGRAGVKQVRGFASLLAYLVGVSAIIGIGVAGLMALQSPIERTPSAPTVAVESRTERLAKPVKQTIVAQKKPRPDQKHKMVRVTPKRTHEAPTITEGDSYGYAQEPRRIDPNLFPFFGR